MYYIYIYMLDITPLLRFILEKEWMPVDVMAMQRSLKIHNFTDPTLYVPVKKYRSNSIHVENYRSNSTPVKKLQIQRLYILSYTK